MATAAAAFRHRQIVLDGLSIHAVERGPANRPAVLFLHGWPQDWSSFEAVMGALGDDRRLVAIDLPGIGLSEGALPSSDKRMIARCVRRLVDALELREVTLAGHDVGAMVVFAYLHEFPDELSRAVLMNSAIPGVEPWSQVVRHPKTWHFAFHALTELPELLVTGHQAAYFDYFFNMLSAHRGGVPTTARAAYARAYRRPAALGTGFDWYRALEQDEQHNLEMRDRPLRTPVLYLRGQRELGSMDDYLRGLRAAGLHDLRGTLIPDSGHYAPDEQPRAVAQAIGRFIGALAP
ncbi:MAG TPA: alpha/beta hydrolase [Burkholderiaceae bacterium]|nr:alpha/beta hydrolase [Burkholderiaceae bacterium]